MTHPARSRPGQANSSRMETAFAVALLLPLALIVIVDPSVRGLVGALLGAGVAVITFVLWSNRRRLRRWAANLLLALAVSACGSLITLSSRTPDRSYTLLVATIFTAYVVVLLTVCAPVTLALFRRVREKTGSTATPVVAFVFAASLASSFFALIYVIDLLPVIIGNPGSLKTIVDPVGPAAAISGVYLGVVVQELAIMAAAEKRDSSSLGRYQLPILLLLLPAGAFPVMTIVPYYFDDYSIAAHKWSILILFAGAFFIFAFATVATMQRISRTQGAVRKHRRWTLISVAAVSLTLGTFFSYSSYSASIAGYKLVTVPYMAEVKYRDNKWFIKDAITLDKDARSELNREIDSSLSSEILRLAGTPWQEDDPTIRQAIEAIRQQSPDAAESLLVEALGVTREESACLTSNCLDAEKIMDRVRAKALDTKLNLAEWTQVSTIDGNPRYVHNRELPAVVPILGSEINLIDLPGIDIFSYVRLIPRARSTILVSTPKAMIAATFPKEKVRADELGEHEEETTVELDSENRSEVRIATLAWIFRSKPGLLAYEFSQWPLLPYLTGTIAVFIVLLTKGRVQKYFEKKMEAWPDRSAAQPDKQQTKDEKPEPGDDQTHPEPLAHPDTKAGKRTQD